MRRLMMLVAASCFCTINIGPCHAAFKTASTLNFDNVGALDRVRKDQHHSRPAPSAQHVTCIAKA
jgi:hypothetical protein